MTVQEICDLLRLTKEAQGLAALTGIGFPQATVPAAALESDFLADNVLKVNDVLLNKGSGEGNQRTNFSSEGELVAQLQANAFLSAYQKAAGQAGGRRCARLASKYTRTIVNGNDTFGPLAGQLRDIGVKVDPDFVPFIAPSEEQA